MHEADGPMVVAAAKLPPRVAAKLERLARDSRRSKSQVIRLLIERALVTDLDVRHDRRHMLDEPSR